MPSLRRAERVCSGAGTSTLGARRLARRLATALLVALAALHLALAAQVPAEATTAHVDAFVKRFVQAIAARDRDAMASLVRYPARVVAGGFSIPVPDRDALFEIYDITFTPELRCLVEQSGLPGAGRPAPKHAARIEGAGVSLGDGLVQTELVDGTLRIASISVPPASAETPPPPVVRRVQFRAGQAQYSGRLYGGGTDTYLVSGPRGARLHARIERFSGSSAFVRVVNTRTGRAIGQPGAAPRRWDGALPDAGEYRVEVVRQTPYCEPSFTYLLTLGLR